MLEIDDHLQTLNIEERRVTVELTKNLEEISLDDNIPSRITHIGTPANPSVHKELDLFLKNIQDVFTWSREDTPRINPSVMVHKLNVSPSFILVRQ